MILPIALAVAIAASCGALLAGVLGSGKLAALYDRQEQLEVALIDQAALISELSAGLSRLLSDLGRNPGNNVSNDNMAFAAQALDRARRVSPLENLGE